MAKWADYLISGIWHSTSNGSKYISHVFLHEDTDENFKAGAKVTRSEIIRLIKAGYSFKTITWNYTSGTWQKGADVSYIETESGEYLRSHKDGTVTDNLDNIIRMNHFV